MFSALNMGNIMLKGAVGAGHCLQILVGGGTLSPNINFCQRRPFSFINFVDVIICLMQ